MRFESRTWFLLSLVLFAAAIYFWKRGNEYEIRKNKLNPQLQHATNAPSASTKLASTPVKLLSQLNAPTPRSTTTPPAKPATLWTTGRRSSIAPLAAPVDPRFPFRLANTPKSVGQLSRVETAVLMRNAFIDTAEKSTVNIPDHLRAEGDPGSYIVQARGPIQAAFRQQLKDVGASIISYIPNNAYLVQLSADGAQQLAGLPETQAVLPYEPYYKLDSKLLPRAVEQQPLAADELLKVTAFPGTQATLSDSITALGGEILAQDRTPFGPQVLVKPAPDSLPAIAKLASVQTVELSHPRELLNDITRVIVGISSNGSTANNYLGLSGANVLVNINDSGVDSTHPDLQGRVTGDTPKVLSDPVAHGTHVAGIIAGNGSKSASVSSTPPGSGPKPDFRGMAPQAEIFVLPYRGFPEVSAALDESYLQETAARTNLAVSSRKNGPMISNNSWGYVGVTEYDSSSARFDAAVRDAVPELSGTQPMIFVFAAGNSGEGDDTGLNGDANTIPSPGNAKNVITVGATEHLRFITNAVLSTNFDGSISTNETFLGLTDSNDQVAAFSSRGNVGIGTEGDFGRFKPDVVAPGSFIISTRGKDWALENQFDTNSAQYAILKDLNEPLAPSYRYESGTSQAAPVVSGMLALMQEFFEQRLFGPIRRTNSPAMMKALLINGARSLGPAYNLTVENFKNYQGWGLVNISNSIPSALSGGFFPNENAWPIRLFDQSPTNALATGQSRSWNVTLSTNAEDVPLRVTLVWTDPPGNPGAAIKLVNDLDLVVSNTVSGEVYYGNNIPLDADFTKASFPDEPVFSDVINNVENVFIADPASTNLVVTVTAKRVNVAADPDFNARTGTMDDIVQDFALVISCGDPTATAPFTITSLANPAPQPAPLTVMTNGLPLINQRAGANPSLNQIRDGVSNQWKFYVFTNVYMTNDFSTLTNGTNVAFVTFLTPNVAVPRNQSADIDLYVSKDPTLVALNPAAVNGAFKSLTRSGTELVLFTNAAIGDVYYIGVKSEDQQSGEFGLIALSTNDALDENKNGSRVLHGLPVPQLIPDGTPAVPGHCTVLAVGINPTIVRRVQVENVLTHEDVGDLSVILLHEQRSVVLHNHSLNDGLHFNVTNFPFIYNDQAFGSGVRHSDGPGSLNTFAGMEGNGVWLMNFVDNAPTHTGSVRQVTLTIDPFVNGNLNAAGRNGIDGSVGPGDDACYYVDVPPEATNMLITVSQLSGPLVALLSHETLPTTNDFQIIQFINPPGGVVSLGAFDEPRPLEAGRYFFCLHNPNANEVTFHLVMTLQLGVGLDFGRTLIGTNATLVDEGLIRSVVNVPVDKEVADVQVAVRIDNPRAADLVLHLISPQGTRVLLAENRGGSATAGYGSGFGTNLNYTIFTEDTNLLLNPVPIKFALPPFTSAAGATSPPTLDEGFETAIPGTYTNGQSFSSWTVTQGSARVEGPANTLGVRAQAGNNFVQLDTSKSPASIMTTFPTVPGKDYQLTFFYARNPEAPFGALHGLQVYYGDPAPLPSPSKFIDVPQSAWRSTNIIFTATSAQTELQIGSLSAVGPLIDSILVTDEVTSTNVYLMPEEPLTLFKSERAMGDWTLEIEDSRLGPTTTTNSVLLGWELLLKYGSPPGKATPLTNGLTFSGVISTNQTNFFVIDVCDSARVAFATLRGAYDTMNLLVSRSGIPTGDENRDEFSPIPNDLPADPDFVTGFATFALTSDVHQPAPLIPGQRLYFAVHNLDPTATNTFDFQVSFDNDTCSGQRPVIRLQNDVAYTNVVAPSGTIFDYYVFTVSPTAVQTEFAVRPQNGDVGMVLSYGLPLPDLSRFDFQSDQPGITNEIIDVTSTSDPVPLQPGDWYIGVYNKSTNAVVYDVRATETLDTNINVIVLTNAVPLNFEIGQGAALTNFFLFRVADDYPGVKFQLTNLTGNADLYIGYNLRPSANAYFLSNSASPTEPISIEIRTNASLPEVRGNWLLEVVNKDPQNLRFTVEASFMEAANPSTGTNRFFDPTLSVTSSNICFSWPTTPGLQYQLQGIKTVVDTNWTALFGPTIATSALMTFCTNLPSEFSFFRVVETSAGSGPPPSSGQIIEPTLAFGTNGLCLTWVSQVDVQYDVQGKIQITDPAWTNILGPITATGALTTECLPTNTPYHFFQIASRASSGSDSGGTGGATNTMNLHVPLLLADGRLQLVWDATLGATYEVDYTTNLVPVVKWIAITNITATSSPVTFTDPTRASNGGVRFYRVQQK